MTPRFLLPYDAEISPCGLYRWWLTRRWDLGRWDGNAVAFIMLNPSTAHARADDPTILRCTRFAKQWGFSGLGVANLYAWRASDPIELERQRARGNDIIGPENDATLLELVRATRLTVVAWGANLLAAERAPAILSALREFGAEPHHLGLTAEGAPKHPLARGRHRIHDDITPIMWTS